MALTIASQKHAIRKKSVNNGRDCISNLPDDILSSIVSYFTVRDAANASQLSRKWRHLCAFIPQLKFCWYYMFGMHNKYNYEAHHCEEYKDRFVRGVNEFLQYHKGYRLNSFRVSFCIDCGCASDIDQWVRFALSRGVEHLHLALTCQKKRVVRSAKRNLYVLRSEIFSHDNAAKVHRLVLVSCIPAPGMMNKFSFLKNLRLNHIPLGQENVESIISCCLNLESIILLNCSHVLKLCISGSLTQLRFLAVLHCSDLKEIELSATNLTTFEYGAKMIRISFSKVPNLEKVYFRVDDGIGLQYVSRKLAKDLPWVNTVSVLSKASQVRALPKEVTTFGNVKRLELFFHFGDLDIGRIIAVLSACPILQSFSLVVRNCIVRFEQGVHGVTEVVSKHLKEAFFGGFDYSASFIEFVIYLLEHADGLEKLILEEEMSVYIGINRWNHYYANKTRDEGECQNVSQILREHSKSAVIIIQ